MTTPTVGLPVKVYAQYANNHGVVDAEQAFAGFVYLVNTDGTCKVGYTRHDMTTQYANMAVQAPSGSDAQGAAGTPYATA